MSPRVMEPPAPPRPGGATCRIHTTAAGTLQDPPPPRTPRRRLDLPGGETSKTRTSPWAFLAGERIGSDCASHGAPSMRTWRGPAPCKCHSPSACTRWIPASAPAISGMSHPSAKVARRNVLPLTRRQHAAWSPSRGAARRVVTPRARPAPPLGGVGLEVSRRSEHEGPRRPLVPVGESCIRSKVVVVLLRFPPP